MTLLIDMVLPEIWILSEGDFIAFIHSLIPSIGFTLVSFILIASFWIYHHEFIKMQWIRHHISMVQYIVFDLHIIHSIHNLHHRNVFTVFHCKCFVRFKHIPDVDIFPKNALENATKHLTKSKIQII